MTLPQAEALEAGMELPDDVLQKETVLYTVLDKPAVPAILLCVEEWHLDNFPEKVNVETFPFSPRKASHELIAWMFNEIRIIYLGETEVPNE